jgi:hypothetical protein
MSIFGIIKCDDQVFSGDKIRINASESFLAQGLLFTPTLSHEISVDSGVTWYDITAKKGIDWVFSSAGIKTISLRLNTTVPSSQIFTRDITVLDILTANLFSKDFDLYVHEPEIDQYLPKKWSSWNLVHKRAQDWIIDFLDEKGIFAEDGTKYTVADIMDKQQVKQLSTYKTLQFIFEGNSNVVGDLFSIKAAKYEGLSNTKASRSQLDLDYNKNTIKDKFEKTDLHKIVVRRS